MTRIAAENGLPEHDRQMKDAPGGPQRRESALSLEQIQEKWKPLFRPDTGGEAPPFCGKIL
jgi:hypothetical protein